MIVTNLIGSRVLLQGGEEGIICSCYLTGGQPTYTVAIISNDHELHTLVEASADHFKVAAGTYPFNHPDTGWSKNNEPDTLVGQKVI